MNNNRESLVDGGTAGGAGAGMRLDRLGCFGLVLKVPACFESSRTSQALNDMKLPWHMVAFLFDRHFVCRPDRFGMMAEVVAQPTTYNLLATPGLEQWKSSVWTERREAIHG